MRVGRHRKSENASERARRSIRPSVNCFSNPLRSFGARTDPIPRVATIAPHRPHSDPIRIQSVRVQSMSRPSRVLSMPEPRSHASSPPAYRSGEEVRHRQRPEWGVGTIQRVEAARRGNSIDQRLWIRFPNIGMKVLLAGLGDLERVNTSTAAGEGILGEGIGHDGHTMADREATHEQGWLGEIARKRPEEAMVEIPPQASDPFLSLRQRLEFTIGLYRFEPSGGRLLDWAVAQSGLNDPLSRFNRHELEELFTRWAHRRDQHLAKLGQEARNEPGLFDSVMKKAPPSAHKALRKLHGRR